MYSTHELNVKYAHSKSNEIETEPINIIMIILKCIELISAVYSLFASASEFSPHHDCEEEEDC